MEPSPRWGRCRAGAEADEVAASAFIKWRDAVLCQQTPPPHPSPTAPLSPVLGEGFKMRRAAVERLELFHL